MQWWGRQGWTSWCQVGPPLRLLQLAVVAVAAVVAALGMSAGIELVSAAPCCCWGS